MEGTIDMSKLSKETKKFLERELRQYKENKRLLERLKKEDKTPSRVILICEDRLKYIENVFNSLTPFEKQMFCYIFFNHYDWAYCETHFRISRSTYYNVYNKCINLLAEEWGEF